MLRRPVESAQYVPIRYSERLAEAGIEPSVGSVGDSYDNALAETINGLYKAEVIHRRGPWRNFEAVEFATLEWVRLVQPPTTSAAHRKHTACRSRRTLLRHAGRNSHGRITQTKWPPANPARFRSLSGAYQCCGLRGHRVLRMPRQPNLRSRSGTMPFSPCASELPREWIAHLQLAEEIKIASAVSLA